MEFAMIHPLIEESMSFQEEPDTMQAYGVVSWPQSLYKPYWHSGLNALSECVSLEPMLAAIDWVQVKEEISNSNIASPTNADYKVWIASLRHSTDVVSYSVMYLENVINDLFKGGTFLRTLDQVRLAENFLTFKDPKNNVFFSAAVGIPEYRRAYLLAQPQANRPSLLAAEITAAVNDPAITDVGSALDHLNSMDRGTSPVQKIKRLKSIIKGFATFGFPYENDIENIVRLRNLLKHGKAVLDIEAFMSPNLPANTLASVLSASPSHQQSQEDSVEKLSTWIEGIMSVKRPIAVFPYGWVGKDVAEFCNMRVAAYCSKLDKFISDSQLPHASGHVSFSHLFAPALSPWP